MLRKGLQYDSYCWTNVIYQGKPCSEYVHKYPAHKQQTPNEKYQFKTGLEVPITKDYPESVLHYSSEYIAESAHFFNSFRFWQHCKMFNVDVRLVGPDAKKYEIQWEIFLSTNRKNIFFERNVHCNEPNHVCLSDGGWIFPSDGYVITINKIAYLLRGNAASRIWQMFNIILLMNGDFVPSSHTLRTWNIAITSNINFVHYNTHKH